MTKMRHRLRNHFVLKQQLSQIICCRQNLERCKYRKTFKKSATGNPRMATISSQSPYFRTISTNQPRLRKPSTLMEHKLYSMLSHSENHLVPPFFTCCIIYIFFFTYLETNSTLVLKRSQLLQKRTWLETVFT